MNAWSKLAAILAVAVIVAGLSGGAGATTTRAGGTIASLGAGATGTERVFATHAGVAQRPAVRSAARNLATRRTSLLRHANLKTVAGVKSYLRAIGVDPRGVVIQRGTHNYAGPRCPGTGWACTSTARPVVQVSTRGGRNTFLCSSKNCAVVQMTTSAAARSSRGLTAAATLPPNIATCIKTTGVTQSCTINQASTSVDNWAIVYELASKMSGLTQTATYSASITQNATTGANKACVYQEVTMDASTTAKKGQPVTVTLRAHQNVTITQNSLTGNRAADSATQSGTCDPSKPVTQKQTLSSTAYGTGSINQLQNDGGDPTAGPNVNLAISQNQAAGYLGVANGTNTATFSQENNLVSDASGGQFQVAGPATMTQSKGPDGGILATVNQFSKDPSTIDAKQRENQCAHAQLTGTVPTNLADCFAVAKTNPLPQGWTETQFGPVKSTGVHVRNTARRSLQKTGKGGCCSIQGNNTADTFTIDQASQQKNDDGQNQTNVMQGECGTTGTGQNNAGGCSLTQVANGQSNPATGSDINANSTCAATTCKTNNVVASGNQVSSSNTDVAESGFGGMRGSGTGSITVSGVTGAVTRAFLYWNGPTNSNDPASNAAVTFNGTAITGTNIGTASSNCWPFTNSQSYRADVTSLVSGNGSYNLSNFTKADADINGVSLIVFYDDGNSSNNRNFVAWNGNDSNVAFGTEPAGWDETINNVPTYPGSGTATLDFVVSDGQQATDGEIDLNGTQVVPQGANFEGDSTPAGPFVPFPPGSLWDVKSFDITSFLSATNPTSIEITSPLVNDCLSLVVAGANVPAP